MLMDAITVNAQHEIILFNPSARGRCSAGMKFCSSRFESV
jgi:hypothetical protein